MDPGTAAALIAAVLGAGGLGAFVQWRKAGKEAESIATTTLIAVNGELRTELERRDGEIAGLRKENVEQRERIAVLENENGKTRSQCEALERKIADLEKRVT